MKYDITWLEILRATQLPITYKTDKDLEKIPTSEVVEDVLHGTAGLLVERLSHQQGELQWDNEDQ